MCSKLGSVVELQQYAHPFNCIIELIWHFFRAFIMIDFMLQTVAAFVYLMLSLVENVSSSEKGISVSFKKTNNFSQNSSFWFYVIKSKTTLACFCKRQLLQNYAFVKGISVFLAECFCSFLQAANINGASGVAVTQLQMLRSCRKP